ncbi:MAG: hypothetical protein KDB22_05460 [Planctomycetales bacterium]|nr:hypothetical protein [Planctomycetales bacterium]
MPRILVTTTFPGCLLARQTPNSSGMWGEFEFIFSPTHEAVDGWVVIDDLPHEIKQVCPRENTLLISGEPQSVRMYRPRFTSQFSRVWTSHASIKHPRLIRRNEGQHWHYAMRAGAIHGKPLAYDELASLARPDKPKLLSVICSNKSVTPDHRQRLEFANRLKAWFGDDIDVFGRGIRTMDDKSEAIWPYKYHIVLENDHSDFFMTEKISDAYLGWSYPIYFGGREAYHRFPEGSFTAIDIYQPEQSISIIQSVLDANTYESSIENIRTARERVLNENNLLAMLAEYFRVEGVQGNPARVSLLPRRKRTRLVLQRVYRAISVPFSRKVA